VGPKIVRRPWARDHGELNAPAPVAPPPAPLEAADEGRWDIDDVAEGLARKLVHRHPHVFGSVEVSGADEVLVNWEKLKAAEVGSRGRIEDGIPVALPSLARAAKVQRRAAGWGFEFRSAEGALAKLREEIDELASASESATDDAVERGIGDVLFATVSIARKLGVDAESALRRTTRTFGERYERMMELATARGVDLEGMSDEELSALFREAR